MTCGKENLFGETPLGIHCTFTTLLAPYLL